MTITVNPYEEGYCAFFSGVSLENNPYADRIKAGDKWILGWTHAELDHDQEMSEYQSVSEHGYDQEYRIGN